MENSIFLFKINKMVTNYIPTHKEFPITSDWDSHRPLLYLSIKNMDTNDTVYEFGCGDGSTKMIRELAQKRVSFETNKAWGGKYYDCQLINSYFDVKFPTNNEVGVLFIDCAPGEIRKELLERWMYMAKVIVIHDTEMVSDYVYNIRVVFNNFKYKLEYNPGGSYPHTTAVSNFIDVTKWV